MLLIVLSKKIKIPNEVVCDGYHMVELRQIEVDSVLHEIFGTPAMPQDSRDTRDKELARMYPNLDCDWELSLRATALQPHR